MIRMARLYKMIMYETISALTSHKTDLKSIISSLHVKSAKIPWTGNIQSF